MIAIAASAFLARVHTACGAEVIYVKILVDEEERTVRAAWETRLRDRLEAASRIINEYANVHFAVSGFDTWQSDNRLTDLSRTLAEFEHEVDPDPAQIAIGFSSQYRFTKGINGLGGTRGPLRQHILLRESSPNTREPERLEALVHELGHFLGAAHSASATSVMRPVIGDGLARNPAFKISFDPHNARIIQWVGSEVSTLGIRRYSQLSERTLRRMQAEYEQIDRQLPRDPAAKHFLQVIHQTLK